MKAKKAEAPKYKEGQSIDVNYGGKKVSAPFIRMSQTSDRPVVMIDNMPTEANLYVAPKKQTKKQEVKTEEGSK